MRSFLSRKYDGEVAALALPALGTLAIDPLVTLADTILVGRLGEQALGALGVNAAIFSVAFFAFNFLAYGTTPMISRALGRGDRAQAGRITSQALFLALVLGCLSLITLQLLAAPLVTFMGASEELQLLSLQYLRVRAFAAPAVLLVIASNGIFRGFRDTRTPFGITLSFNLVNIALDVTLIFGFGWGLVGAATATVVAQWLGAVWFVRLILRGRLKAPLQFAVPRLAEVAPFLQVGWQLALRTLSLLLTMAFATSVATRIGVTEVAAHQVANQLWLFLVVVADALAIAAQALVARYLGQGDLMQARAVASRLLMLGLVAGVALAGLFWLGRPVIPGLFATDPEVVSAIDRLYPLIDMLLPISAIVFVWDGIFIGLEDFGYLASAMVLSAALACGLLMITLVYGLGLTAVWVALIALMLARGVTLAARFVNFSGYSLDA
jgi:MATE family multidrug resistance protein